VNEREEVAAEIETLNIDELDVDELEQRLEMTVAEGCDCWSNSCSSYCNPAPK